MSDGCIETNTIVQVQFGMYKRLLTTLQPKFSWIHTAA